MYRYSLEQQLEQQSGASGGAAGGEAGGAAGGTAGKAEGGASVWSYMGSRSVEHQVEPQYGVAGGARGIKRRLSPQAPQNGPRKMVGARSGPKGVFRPLLATAAGATRRNAAVAIRHQHVKKRP